MAACASLFGRGCALTIVGLCGVALLLVFAADFTGFASRFQTPIAFQEASPQRRSGAGRRSPKVLSPEEARLGVCSRPGKRAYEATSASLGQHEVPQWFQDAKLGIFVHWGLYSVPAFATPQPTPYAEWYLHSSLVKGSTTASVHKKRYGEEPSMKSYLKHFIPAFNRAASKWDPAAWAAAFWAAGAGYVVLTTKHHDSFCLWPVNASNPGRSAQQQHAERDIVGELSTAVRKTGMQMGLYYSGGIDWSFNVTTSGLDLLGNKAYEKLAHAQLKELIARYRPAVLWDDMNFPGRGPSKRQQLYDVFAQYFNRACPEGVVNKRWHIEDIPQPPGEAAPQYTGDFGTPEYTAQTGIVNTHYFEYCRGIGKSFGYNAEEGPREHMTPAETVWLLADVVARNGNLLLDVGPAANGSIPELQMRVLRALAAWMGTNSEAIHGARPYLQPGTAAANDFIRYTRKPGRVYALVRCITNCPKSVVKLDRPELMRRHARAKLLAPGGPIVLKLSSRGWVLPSSARLGAMPLVLRLTPPSWESRRR